jgi:indole-3-glycerol phosphate synthase
MNILNQILEHKKEEISKLRKKFTLNSFRGMEFFHNKSLSFSDSLKRNGDLSIIAEIKKASPSKGIIRNDFNHLRIADIYFKEEVNAVSILTDQNFFRGDIQFLNDIAGVKQSPLLRKDFIIDEYQVFESKANGADAILLICEALSKGQIKEFSHAATEIGMDVLLELHSEEQLDKIDFEINNIIGVNNRNLEDFSVSLETTSKLGERLPNAVFLVAESGIKKKEDITYLKKTRTNAILVGEHLMSSGNIRDALKHLKEWCSNES